MDLVGDHGKNGLFLVDMQKDQFLFWFVSNYIHLYLPPSSITTHC